MGVKLPVSGNGKDAVALCTPGSEASRSCNCRWVAARCRSVVRVGGRNNWNVNRFRESKPGSIFCSARKLRNMRPEPISRTNDSATSTTTTQLRSRRAPLRLEVRPLARSTVITSGRVLRRAGNRPKMMAAPRPANAEKPKTTGSSRMESRRGKLAGAI